MKANAYIGGIIGPSDRTTSATTDLEWPEAIPLAAKHIVSVRPSEATFEAGDRVFFPIQMTVTEVSAEGWVHLRYDDGTPDCRKPGDLAHVNRSTDYATATSRERTLRNLLRLIVGHLEVDAKAGDGIHEDAYDDYHAARMLVGQAGDGWDADAAGRAMRRLTGDERWAVSSEKRGADHG